MIKINGKVRTDERFPIGVNDIMQTVDKFFQVTYDSNGRFSLISISEKQARFKALRVVKKYTSVNKVPMIQTNDGGHFRYAHPKIKVIFLYYFQESSSRCLIKFHANFNQISYKSFLRQNYI